MGLKTLENKYIILLYDKITEYTFFREDWVKALRLNSYFRSVAAGSPVIMVAIWFLSQATRMVICALSAEKENSSCL